MKHRHVLLHTRKSNRQRGRDTPLCKVLTELGKEITSTCLLFKATIFLIIFFSVICRKIIKRFEKKKFVFKISI